MKHRAVSILLFAALGAVCLAGCAAVSPEEPESAALTVYGFSAGAADAFLLTAEDTAVLIDCGEKGFGKEIAAYLDGRGIERLDALIITHFDKDHVGGAAKVLSSVPVGRVLQSNHPKDSKEYDNYIEALDEAGLVAETVRETLRFTLGGVEYEIDPPAGGYTEDGSNNSSLIVSVSNGADRLLFMGDAESQRIAEFLGKGSAACDFLKVPHHGRFDDRSAALVDAARPKLAVVTSSDDEPEDAEVVALLERAGAEVFLTRTGAVLAESGGHGVTARYAD